MTPHLRGHVRAYVDRALPPAILHVYDRHLVCCVTCRAAADQERRIVASLRSESAHVPGTLRLSLMGLAATPIPPVEPEHAPRIPLGPLATLAPRGGRAGGAVPTREPVPTVPPSAPALHRSPMRAAVVASLAAGASVAAAWGLAISPLPGGGRPALVRVPSGIAGDGANQTQTVVSDHTGHAGLTGSSSRLWVVEPIRSTVQSVLSPSALSGSAPSAPVRISLVSSAESRP